MTDPLTAAVHRLTRATRTKVIQEGGKVATVTHDPLLVQLADAVNPSKNSSAGSAALAANRNLVDPEALWEYAKMTAAISGWCLIVRSERTRNAVTDLEGWCAAFGKSGGDPTGYVSQLDRWAKKIDKLLHPANVSFTLEKPCPVCGKTEWGDVVNGGGAYPVQVECWVDEDNGEASGHTATCKSCRAVWHGREAVMELAEEVTEQEGNSDTQVVA